MGLFKIDTHVHTSSSSCCARVTGSELVHLYKANGYHGVVITEHLARDYSTPSANATWTERIEHFLSGYREAYKEGKRVDFAVMLGMELRFTENENDYLVYGLDEAFLEENEDFYEMGLASFSEFVKDQDILIYQAHPFRSGMVKVDPLLLDGLEVFNGNPRADSKNGLAYTYAKTHGLRMLSGSDFHRPEDVGLGGIIIAEEVRTTQDLMRLLRGNHIVELIRSES
jgi:predicted metal-dependent phosphoesterase TrpH